MYFNSLFGTVDWDEGVEAVWVTTKQFAEGEEFRELCEAGLNLLVERRAKRWLADVRNMGPVAQADQKWSAEDWTPRAAAGLSYMAFVSPRRIVAQMAVKTFTSRVKGRDLLIGNFAELDQAKEWLKAQP